MKRKGTEEEEEEREGEKEEWKGEVVLNRQQQLALSKCKNRESIGFCCLLGLQIFTVGKSTRMDADKYFPVNQTAF